MLTGFKRGQVYVAAPQEVHAVPRSKNIAEINGTYMCSLLTARHAWLTAGGVH